MVTSIESRVDLSFFPFFLPDVIERGTVCNVIRFQIFVGECIFASPNKRCNIICNCRHVSPAIASFLFLFSQVLWRRVRRGTTVHVCGGGRAGEVVHAPAPASGSSGEATLVYSSLQYGLSVSHMFTGNWSIGFPERAAPVVPRTKLS